MPDIIKPPSAKSLREQRKPLSDRICQMRDLIYKDAQGATTDKPQRDFSAEERTEWDTVNKEYDQLTSQLQIAESAERVEKDRVLPAGDFDPRSVPYDGKRNKKERTKEERVARQQARDVQRQGWNADHIKEEDRALCLQGWMRSQAGLGLKRKHEEAARNCGVSVRRRYLDVHLQETRAYRKLAAEARAQALTPNTAGGYLVPEGFVGQLEMALLAYANVRQWADVMRTASGQDLPWPTVNDTTSKGYRLQENAQVTERDMTFGQAILHAYKYTSGLVQVPVELLEDSAFDLAAILGELLGIRIGRIQADEFTFGTGNSQPFGYVTSATQGIQAASSTAIAADDLYKLKHSIDPAYRNQPGVGWTWHDQILLAIKLLKDGLGRYLWQPGLSGTAPATVDGDPYYINQSQASTIASGYKTLVYGALKKYKIRDVSQIRLRRLVERYADSDQEGFVMFMRSDATLLDAGTHPIKYLVH